MRSLSSAPAIEKSTSAPFERPIVEVVAGGDVQNAAFTDVQTGTLVNSGFLDGLEVADAKKKIIEYLKRIRLVHQRKTIS